jgi:hypothetical protein
MIIPIEIIPERRRLIKKIPNPAAPTKNRRKNKQIKKQNKTTNGNERYLYVFFILFF